LLPAVNFFKNNYTVTEIIFLSVALRHWHFTR